MGLPQIAKIFLQVFKVKNISKFPIENIVVCGMIYEEGKDSRLCYLARYIFPFKNIPLLLPEETICFTFISKHLLQQEEDKDKFHAVIFVQNIETKKVLQVLHTD